MVTKKDAKTETNIIYGFGSHKSVIMLWFRPTDIEEYMRDLKKNEIYIFFVISKNIKSEPELFLILEVMDKIFIKAYN